MRIEVTTEDIFRGNPMDCRSCPIAWALYRATGRQWAVFAASVRPGDGPIFQEFALPPEAQRFITNFDDGSGVGPFSFEIELDSVINAQAA